MVNQILDSHRPRDDRPGHEQSGFWDPLAFIPQGDGQQWEMGKAKLPQWIKWIEVEDAEYDASTAVHQRKRRYQFSYVKVWDDPNKTATEITEKIARTPPAPTDPSDSPIPITHAKGKRRKASKRPPEPTDETENPE